MRHSGFLTIFQRYCSYTCVQFPDLPADRQPAGIERSERIGILHVQRDTGVCHLHFLFSHRLQQLSTGDRWNECRAPVLRPSIALEFQSQVATANDGQRARETWRRHRLRYDRGSVTLSGTEPQAIFLAAYQRSRYTYTAVAPNCCQPG